MNGSNKAGFDISIDFRNKVVGNTVIDCIKYNKRIKTFEVKYHCAKCNKSRSYRLTMFAGSKLGCKTCGEAICLVPIFDNYDFEDTTKLQNIVKFVCMTRETYNITFENWTCANSNKVFTEYVCDLVNKDEIELIEIKDNTIESEVD